MQDRSIDADDEELQSRRNSLAFLSRRLPPFAAYLLADAQAAERERSGASEPRDR